MSDSAAGDGWWLASDGKWYPPPMPQPEASPVGVISNILVDARGARSIDALGMTCDKKEIPEFLSRSKPKGWWLVGDARFEGSLHRGGETAALQQAEPMGLQGLAAIAIGEGRVIGILAKASVTEPALWFSWPESHTRVESIGSQGVVKKRPASILLRLDESVPDGPAVLSLSEISQLFRHSNSVQHGREASFLKALSN